MNIGKYSSLGGALHGWRHSFAVAVALAGTSCILVWWLRGAANVPLITDAHRAEHEPVEGATPSNSDSPATPRVQAPAIDRDSDPPTSPTEQSIPTDFPKLAEMHGKPAPAVCQAKAHKFFLGYAENLRQRLASARPIADWPSVLAEADDRYSLRLAELCAERAAAREGLLLVGGMKELPPVRFSMTVFDVGGDPSHGLRVTVRIEPDDAELLRLDAAYWDLRAMWLTELLMPFNALNYETRLQRIGRFEQERRSGTGKRTETLGLPGNMLPFVEIAPQTMTAMPRRRP